MPETVSFRMTVSETDHVPNGGKAARAPKGVFLRGGKLFPSAEAALMAGGTLVACSAATGELCIQTSGTGVELRTGLIVDRVLRETWKHVYGPDKLDSYYLSIDPTAETLRSDFANWPSAQLRPQPKHNRVVVQPEALRHEEIGEVLFQADVLFKSAALGYDVLSGPGAPLEGYSSHKEMIRSIIDNKALPTSTDGQRRMCRFYWASEPFGVSIEGDQVIYSGSGVAAHSEAMVVKGGELKPFPGGYWCSGGVKIAQDLTRRVEKIVAKQAKPAGPFAVLRRLADVERKLALLTWARDAGVSIDPKLQDTLQGTTSEVTSVPEWTSGVRSDEKAHVRLDLRNQWAPRLRVYVDDVSSLVEAAKLGGELVDCIERNVSKIRAKERTLGRSLTPEEGDQWLRTREREMRDVFAHSTAKVVRESTWEPSKDWVPREGEVDLADFSVSEEWLPIQATGGVLLRAVAAEAVDSAIARPNGGRVFLSKDETLHFWVAHDHGDLDVEHMALTGLQVVSRDARDGVLRFMLKTRKNAKPRGIHETRFAKQYATEWTRRLPLGGMTESSTFYSQENNSPELRTVDLTALAATDDGRRLIDDLGIKLFKVSNETYLVEVNATGVSAALESRWKQVEAAKDLLGAVRHSGELARFGFRNAATKRMITAISWLDEGVDDAVLSRAGGLENIDATGDDLLTDAAATTYVSEDLGMLTKYVDEGIRLTRPATAAALVKRLRQVFDNVPAYGRASAREELISRYQQLALQPNPTAVKKIVNDEIKLQTSLLATEKLLRDGTADGRI